MERDIFYSQQPYKYCACKKFKVCASFQATVMYKYGVKRWERTRKAEWFEHGEERLMGSLKGEEEHLRPL